MIVWWYNFLREIPLKDFLNLPKIKLILAVKPYTMLDYRRLAKLYEIAVYLEKERIDGGFVECGVWNGGSAAIMARVTERALDTSGFLMFGQKRKNPILLNMISHTVTNHQKKDGHQVLKKKSKNYFSKNLS